MQIAFSLEIFIKTSGNLIMNTNPLLSSFLILFHWDIHVIFQNDKFETTDRKFIAVEGAWACCSWGCLSSKKSLPVPTAKLLSSLLYTWWFLHSIAIIKGVLLPHSQVDTCVGRNLGPAKANGTDFEDFGPVSVSPQISVSPVTACHLLVTAAASKHCVLT